MNKQSKFMLSVIWILCCLFAMAGCGKKEEEYRQIQVYRIDGAAATVERQGSSMDAYENMQLQSGDIIETIAESYLQLKLDEDKYILVEPETKISLQASGNSVDSKTSIYLEKGAIVNQIDNPLSEDSSYEITTPNSTMAVRGTTFRVELTIDEKGESHAKVAVYGGKVECNLVFPDGTITTPVMVEPGTEVLIRGDDVESEYVMTGKTDYDDLKIKVIDFLGVIIDRGEELSITKEELEVLKEELENLEEEQPAEEESEEEEKEEEESEEEKKVEEDSVKEPEEEKTEEEPKEEEKKEDDSASSSDSDSSSEDDSSSGGTSAPVTPPQRTITINFKDENGNIYATATQKVGYDVESIKVKKPTLQPGSYLDWQFEEDPSSIVEGKYDSELAKYKIDGLGIYDSAFVRYPSDERTILSEEEIILIPGSENLTIEFSWQYPQ